MQKRYGKDVEFILKKKNTPEEVRDWVLKVFSRELDEGNKLPKEVFDWFVKVVMKAFLKADNDQSKRMILIKVIHTREVVRAGFDIVVAEKDVDWNYFQVGTVCLLHDIARFDQALMRSFSDKKTDFDHALVGSEMIKKQNFSTLSSLGIDKESVICAVENHSKYLYEGENRYAKLIRDADKLALLRAMPEHLAVEDWGFAEEGVTEEALKSFVNNKLVLHKHVNTKADLFLAWLVWENDLNFTATKRAFIDEGIRDWMVGELAKLKVRV